MRLDGVIGFYVKNKDRGKKKMCGDKKGKEKDG